MIGTIIEAGGKLIDLAGKGVSAYLEEARAVKEQKLSGAALRRAYYIEVGNNLALLHCLNMDALTGARFNDPPFAALVARLETRIASALLLDEKAARKGGLYRLLKSADATAAGVSGKKIISAVASTLTSIDILRKLSTLEAEEGGLYHDLHLKTRVENLQKRFVEITKALWGMGGVTGLAADD